MKKFADLHSNKGFTLVEIVVALLITGILLGTISSVFLMSQKFYNRGEAVSYKEGTVTNTETNLQNYLSVATGVALASAPKTDQEESYSIGFKADGSCEEVIMSLVVDSSGNPVLENGQKKYTESVNSIKHLSEIYVQTIGNTTATLNYKLIPTDTTMTTLSGGIVMNNITAINKNMPENNLIAGSNLNVYGNENHYLVLSFGDVSGGAVEPATDINGELKDKGVIAGNWDLMIAYAAASKVGGYLLSPDGAVYTDSTGTYVTAKTQYIHQPYAAYNPPPTADDYYTECEHHPNNLNNLNNSNSPKNNPNEYFFKISSETRVITEADYDTDPNTWQYWKDGKVPKLGELYLYNGAYYIWQSSSSYECNQNPAQDQNWLKLVSAPEQFR